MLSKKEILLLEALINAKEQYLSSLYLASTIGVTDRTARKYLQNLIEVLSNQGAEIVSKQGQGYILIIHDEMIFQSFWKQILKSKKELTNIRYLETTEDRQRYIIGRLLLDNQVIGFDELLQELFISKTTLLTDVNRIKETLQSYGLSLEHYKKQLLIKGSEPAIRHFLIDYFTDDALDESILATVNPSFAKDIDIPQLLMIVLEECRNAKVTLSDYIVHNLVLHIALMIERIKFGYPLKHFEVDETLKQSLEYNVALKILYRVEEATQIQFPIEEANYIALHLKVKHSSPRYESEETDLSLYKHIRGVLDELSHVLQITLSNDHILLNGLLAHFSPLLTRLEKQIQLSNPLLSDIRRDYQPYFELTKLHFQRLPELSYYDINDDEWAYIAIHLIAAIERYNTTHKRRVLVVCATGYGSAMMLKSRLENEFSSSISITDVVGYYDISEKKLKDVDLIISSLTLPSHLFLTPVINVSVFLTDDEVSKIKNYLSSRHIAGQKKNYLAYQSQSLDMLDLFQPHQFVVIDKKLTRSVLIEIMIEKLEEANKEGFLSQFMQQVDLRESYGSIVYGDCLAFPHPVRAISQKEQVVVAICPNTIYWDDEHPEVKFVFLLSPSQVRNKHLKNLSSCLADFVENRDLQNILEKNPTYNQLINVFNTLYNT